MPKIKPLTNEEESKINAIEDSVDSKLELIRLTAKVKSRINKDISEDFVFAKLENQEKQGVINLTVDAYMSRRIIDNMIRNERRYVWKKEEKRYIFTTISDKEIKHLKEIRDSIFDAFMNRIYMIAIMNRNVDKNHLIKLLAGALDDQEDQQHPDELKTDVKKGIIESLKPERGTQI